MVNEVIGHSLCPVCVANRVLQGNFNLDGLFEQEVRSSDKSKKPYINCDECGAQTFARMPVSVKILRVLATQGKKPDSLSVPEKQPEAAQVVAGQAVEKTPVKTPLKPAPNGVRKTEPAPPLMASAEKKPEDDEGTPLLDFVFGLGKKSAPAEKGGAV